MKKFEILLSTYNGERYISEQLNSLMNQTHRNFNIIIRDDGSTDQTSAIVSQWASNYPDWIRFVPGENIGVIKSFLWLLQHSSSDSDYFCFCDQDDVWMPHKLTSAATHLESLGTSNPAMVFTSTQMTTSDLTPIKVWPSAISKVPSFYNALIQNIAVGATIAFNREARSLLCSKQPSAENVLMHDWWVYLCVSAFGKVRFEPEPSILYRQHANNVVGGEGSTWDKIKKKWQSYRKHKGRRLLHKQALEFYTLYGDQVDSDKREQLTLFLAPRPKTRDRMTYLYRSKLYRQSTVEQVLFKFLILIHYV
ncbi:glycosyltransferase family 2 protein [Paenibacillus lycopersici]|uniref:Glycosyltransferase family 2 protein n=1 Tax=Paenibacillus lycopersici TaxID=2704462 RepID=A0A6C0FQU3_9BACL|nr:glycosyltransferase family 2 protein [Paenibacillus lycopersici]QHT59257.1 glycosyltransferase family 2 protein [Paenibacillus lycopersici]